MSELGEPENGEGGARAALAGFLYEIVGVLGLTVFIEEDFAEDIDEDFATLLRSNRDAIVWHERWGQDAAVLPKPSEVEDAGGTLIQFKYSLANLPRPLQPAELKRIADRLYVGAETAAAEHEPIARFVLFSNRPLSPESPELLADARLGKPISNVTQGGANVLRRLILVVGKPAAYWYLPLEQFTSKFGADAAECAEVVNKLVGARIQNVVADRQQPITLADVTEALLGSREAHSLVRSDPNGVLAQARRALPPEEIAVIPREALQTLGDLARVRALIAVVGPGGSGKTTAVVYWLRGVAQESDAAFISFVRAAEVTRAPIAQTFMEYMGLREARVNWMLDDIRALRRLHSANPNCAHPILFLALDAADEPANQVRWRGDVEMVIRTFAQWDARALATGEPPDATLIVTCRDEDDLRSFWLANDYDRPARDDAFETVEIGYFSDGELRAAAEHLAPELRDRIQGAIAQSTTADSLQTVDSVPSPHSDELSDQVVRKLSHPALWGAFAHLTNDIQRGVLEGRREALRALAQTFVDQFGAKVTRRGLSGGLRRAELLLTLGHVARACPVGAGLTYDSEDWDASAREAGAGIPSRLRSEAIGYGIVAQVDRTRWRWQHDFVQEYLADL
jgi:hypothetical protein